MTDRPVRTLISADRLAARVREIGAAVTDGPTDAPLTVLGVMTGGLLFLADLVRAVERPLQLGVLHARSYEGTTSGPLSLNLETLPDLRGRRVLVVDDIFDTGQTLTRIVAALADRGPASVETAVILSKRIDRQTDYVPDHVGFEIGDEFVVGYGLDLDGEYRNLPYVGVVGA